MLTTPVQTWDPQSFPSAPIGKVAWESTVAVKRSSEGSGGVLYVRTKDGVVVVKANATVAQVSMIR